MDPTQPRNEESIHQTKNTIKQAGITKDRGEGGRTEGIPLEHSYSSLTLYAELGLQKPHERPSYACQPSLLLCDPPLLASLNCVSNGSKAAMLMSTLCEFNFLPGILGLPGIFRVLGKSN